MPESHVAGIQCLWVIRGAENDSKEYTDWIEEQMPHNTLYYGDNLKILMEHVLDNSVDLVYLDPPFNSKADYNILFREPTGIPSEAQITV